MGKSVFSIISFKTGIIYFPVALGSPGPLDKNIPLGLYSIISLKDVVAGTTFISQPKSDNDRSIFLLIPKSIAIIFLFFLNYYIYLDLTSDLVSICRFLYK